MLYTRNNFTFSVDLFFALRNIINMSRQSILTPEQKLEKKEALKIKQREWFRNHPELRRIYLQRYRAKHPDKYYDGTQRSNKIYAAKRTMKKVIRKSRMRAEILLKAGNPKNNSMDKNVSHHLARGRDVGTIAVWMEIPVSIVQQSIDRISQKQKTS